jgi:hypothetical protein
MKADMHIEHSNGTCISVELGRTGDGFIPLLHSDVTDWSHSLYKDYLDMMVTLKEWLKEEGHDSVYVLIPDDDEQLEKWEHMFGFKTINTEGGHRLMWQEL